jgi:DNA replication and repair protein RecF
MHLSWLDLRDFRSYPALAFEPSPGINVLVGPNGAGKTTVLEAIAYLSGLSSFRRTPDAALIRAGADGAVVRGGFEKEAGETRIEVEIPAAGRRRVLVNGKRPGRLADVASIAPVVAFLPDDLDLVKESAAIRRRYVDDLGSQLAPGYAAAVAEYDQTLRQRNALLRRDGPATDLMSLEVWDERLVAGAIALWYERVGLMARLGVALDAAHSAVAGRGELLSVVLRPAWGGDEDARNVGEWSSEHAACALRDALLARRRRELEQRTTTVGPHRDDITLMLGHRDVRTQASQGEQRSVAVAMRVASYRLLRERHGQPPVLLLDDVFSELDLARTAAVVEMLPEGQVLVTTTREDEVPVGARRWAVGDGRVD